MLRRILGLFAIFLLALPAFAQTPAPTGWTSLLEALRTTPISDAAQLQGRAFDLSIPSTDRDDSLVLEPQEAFQLTPGASAGQFRVTILDPEKLIERGLLTRYRPISYRYVRRGIEDFGVAIEGSATCKYDVRFRQSGVGDLDLSQFSAPYVVSYELAGEGEIQNVVRDGPGYTVTRVAGSSGPAGMRLQIKGPSDDVRTDWIPIPSCSVPAVVPETPVVPVTPTTVTQCLQSTIVEATPCTTCGELTVDLVTEFRNTCSRTVRCHAEWVLDRNGSNIARTAFDVWVGGGGTHRVNTHLARSPAVTNFTIPPTRLTNCRYLD